MTKIEFSMNTFQRSVLPNLEKTINSLDLLINKCYQLSIPSDFKYRTYLLNLDSDFKGIKNSVISVKDWIDKSNKKYNNLVDEIRQNSVNLNNIQIGKKYSSIR